MGKGGRLRQMRRTSSISKNVKDNGCLLVVMKAKRDLKLNGIDFERFLKEDVYRIIT